MGRTANRMRSVASQDLRTCLLSYVVARVVLRMSFSTTAGGVLSLLASHLPSSPQDELAVREFLASPRSKNTMKTIQHTIRVTTDMFSFLDDIELDGLESRSTSAGLAKPANAVVDPNLPPIILLHGITNCHLKDTLDDDNRIWLDYIDLVRGRFSRFLTLQSDGTSDQTGTHFETDGPLWKKYRTAIRTWQEEGFDANVFCYDWRKSVVEASQKLHQHLVTLDAVRRGKKAVLVCHSMGGVVASYWAATQSDWDKYVERCVFVGSPLGGSYSSAQAIMGLSPSFKKMALLSIKESMKDFQRMTASFPGLVDLLPNPEVFPEALDLFQRDGWPGNIFPQQKLLDQSRAVKRVVWNSPLFKRSIHLISTGLSTLAGMPWDESRKSRSDSVVNEQGDGAVLNRSSMPSGLKTYLVSGEHSMLLNERTVIDAVLAIAKGKSPSLLEINTPPSQETTTVVEELAFTEGVASMRPPSPVSGKVEQAIEEFASDDMKNAMRGIRTFSTSHTFARIELENYSFSWQNCFSLALASQLAYQKDEVEISSVAIDEWGFPFARAFDEEDTQGIVLSDEKIVVLAYRGSEVNIGDWIGNLNVAATETPIGRIHRGFWAAYQDAEPAIQMLLSECYADQKALWICGHSLGGALAVITGAMLHVTHKISGVYTYGQPKLCVNTLDNIYRNHLSNRYVRIVNVDDVVAKIPPGYSHFGQLRWFADDGSLRSSGSFRTESTPSGLDVPVIAPQELNQQEFEDLQKRLQQREHFLESPSLRASLSTKVQTESLFGISFEDHSLANGYIPAIADQL